MMKKLLIVLFILISGFLIFSCSSDGDEENGDDGNNDTIPGPPSGAFSLSQYGITWYFNRTLTPGVDYGQFVNGDYWVVGTANIIYIDPHSTEINGRTKNGSMLNPDPGIGNEGYHEATQGYDSHAFGDNLYYAPELNVALDVTPSNPLILPPGSSLISSISFDQATAQPQLQTAAVLTILDSIPPSGSFRPPYSGNSKIVSFNISVVNSNISKLANLDRSLLLDVPSVAEAQSWLSRPWIDHTPNLYSQQAHPADNMPRYGGDMADRISEAAAWLHCNFTTEEKMPLLIGLIQYGIDLYAIAQNGYEDPEIGMGIIAQWPPNGGQNAGRKWPIIFAGAMLNDTNMQNISSQMNILFQEDGGTFYVTQESVDFSGYYPLQCGADYEYNCGGYTASLIGMPDWGIHHETSWVRDTPRWITRYRQCCNAANWGGFVLSAIIMDLTAEWNHNALFDYMDRYIQYEDSYYGGLSRQSSLFVGSFWDQYRSLYDTNWTMTDWSTFNTIVYNMYPEDQ